MSEKDPKDMAREVYKFELKAGETMNELFTEFDPEHGEEAMLEVFDELSNSIEDQDRLKKLVILTDNFGRTLGSQRLVQRANREAKENDKLVMQEDLQ